jgi:hypothetical protein
MIGRFLHSVIVNFISWYLRNKCGYAVHSYPYGKRGRYIVMMTENQYHDFRERVEWPAEAPRPDGPVRIQRVHGSSFRMMDE